MLSLSRSFVASSTAAAAARPAARGGAQSYGVARRAPLPLGRWRCVSTTPRAQSEAAAAASAGILPGLPSEEASPGGEVGWLYDSYAAEGAAGGIVDFATKMTETKPDAAPLREVVLSNHSKHSLHISRHKLNDVCRTIRGLSAHEASVQLYFSQKRVSTAVQALLVKAVKVAKDRGYDEERLVIGQAFVGRDTPLVRRRYHSMSRGGKVHKPRSQLTLHLTEVPHGDRRAVGRIVTHRGPGKLPSTPRWKKPV